MNFETIVREIKVLLEEQKKDLTKNRSYLSKEDLETLIFGESDVVETYLREHNVSEDDVNLEDLRDLQFKMLSELENKF